MLMAKNDVNFRIGIVLIRSKLRCIAGTRIKFIGQIFKLENEEGIEFLTCFPELEAFLMFYLYFYFHAQIAYLALISYLLNLMLQCESYVQK